MNLKENEKKYFISLIDKVKSIDLIIEGFYVMGNENTDEKTKSLVYYNDVDSWIRNINYINEQVKGTAELLLKVLEKNKDVNPSFSGIENREAYYHIENIMFRVSILWDLLAQLTNATFRLNENVDEIQHRKFFTKYSANVRKKELIYPLAKSVDDYFEEDDCDQVKDPWKGNFKFSKNLRNSFTHSLNPHMVNFNNAKFKRGVNANKGSNLAMHPLYETKRILEDFISVYDFSVEVRKKYVDCSEL
jgi:Cthe_2314-like HEPN